MRRWSGSSPGYCWARTGEPRRDGATVVVAHLDARATRGDVKRRYARKLALTRNLYQGGLTKQRFNELYHFIG